MTYQPVVGINPIYTSGSVTLWHTNPDLAQTVDTLAGHGGRVARIIIKLWPDSSVALLHWALVHDDGESVVGDVPAPAKGATVIHEQERAALDRIWPGLPDLTPDEYERLRFADRLDAYMWAKHHAPHVLDGDGWPECRHRLFVQAEARGVAVAL
jgi:hypothetical protein